MSVVAEGRVVTDVGCLRAGQYPRTERCAKISRMVKAEEAKGMSSSLMPDYAGLGMRADHDDGKGWPAQLLRHKLARHQASHTAVSVNRTVPADFLLLSPSCLDSAAGRFVSRLGT